MSTVSQPHVGVLFFVAHRAVEQRVIERVQAAGHRVTQAQGRVAARIAPEGTRLTELAAAAQVTKQTAGFLVDQLERQGLVERVPDPRDGRARLVRVAERGAQAVALTVPVVAEVEAQWRAHLGEQRWTQLRDALAALREITDPWA